MSSPRYESYKDSGVGWLGEVPTQWHVSALKRVVSLRSGDAITAEDIEESGQFPVYGGNGLRGYTATYTHDGQYVLVGRQGALCGNINYASGKFWASEHAVVLTPLRQVAVFWLGELLRAMNLNQYSVSAAQPGLSVETVSNLRIPVPPLSEQRAIAAFLDRETTKIDALVNEQKRLIELLKEKRQAVISQAVTKGLDPKAPMKHSGVAWLGEVPEHWEVFCLKRILRSVDYGISNSLDNDGKTAILRMGNIQEGKVVFDDLKYVDAVPSQLILRPGDLLFNRTNSLDLIGKVGLFGLAADAPISFASYLVRLRATNDAEPKYLAYLLNTPGLLGIARANALVAIGQCNLNPTRYGEIRVAIPPLLEQQNIVAYLDHQTGKIDALVSEADCAIALLQERRGALISAAVTGEIDVRTLVPVKAEAA